MKPISNLARYSDENRHDNTINMFVDMIAMELISLYNKFVVCIKNMLDRHTFLLQSKESIRLMKIILTDELDEVNG